MKHLILTSSEAPKSFDQTEVKGGKVHFNGYVAVLVSHGFGAGWQTWNTDVNCLFTPEVVKQVMEGTASEDSLKAVYAPARVYCGGLDGLCVKWVLRGSKFKVSEYDGAEGLEFLEEVDWQTA